MKITEEKVYYENDCQKIAAILSTPKSASKKGVILLHGFTGDKNGEGESYPTLAKRLCENGFNVLRFDCRGSGESEGLFEDMTFSSEVSDLLCSIDFMRDKGVSKLCVVGSSFGGAVTLLAYQDNLDCIVLWYPLIYVNEGNTFRFSNAHEKEMFEKGRVLYKKGRDRDFFMGKKLWHELREIKPQEKLGELKCPVLVVNGDNDRTLSLENADKAMAAIKSKKKLVVVKGAFHFWKDGENKVVESYRIKAIEATVDWITTCM